MLQGLAEILKGLIVPLNFVDLIGGVVQMVQIPQVNFMDTSIKTLTNIKVPAIRIPATDNYQTYIPDSRNKSVIYFEDGGVTCEVVNRRYNDYVGKLKLVGWLNFKKISKTATVNDIIQLVLKNIVGEQPNNGLYCRMFVNFKGQEISSDKVFSEYDYKEEITQLLMYPFAAFALNLEVQFSISSNCVQDIVIEETVCR